MNAANEHLKDVETLTVRVLDNLHDQEDMDRLSALLSESAEARSRYSELVILDSMLHWETSEVIEFEQPVQKTLSFPRLPMVASFAAAIIIGVKISSTLSSHCFQLTELAYLVLGANPKIFLNNGFLLQSPLLKRS